MGAVLTPSLIGVETGGQLPNASTFCGRCEAVCPMRIPLPKMMRHWREREFEKNLTPGAVRFGLGFWRALATRPRLFSLFTRCTALGLKLMAMGKGRLSKLPMGGGWTDHRDFPAPQGGTFQSKWKSRK
jgi:L-lactate dehydrogenase complex protein LldF